MPINIDKIAKSVLESDTMTRACELLSEDIRNRVCQMKLGIKNPEEVEDIVQKILWKTFKFYAS